MPTIRFLHFRRAATLDPNWIPARIALASTLAAQGKLDKAIDEYRAIIPMSPESRPLLVRLMIQRNLKSSPELRTWDEIDRLLDQGERDAPEAIETILLRGEECMARDKPGDAKSLSKPHAIAGPIA